MIAGAIAGSATVIITNPIWVVNTRVTTQKRALDADDKGKAKLADEEAGVASEAKTAADADPTTTAAAAAEAEKKKQQKVKRAGTLGTLMTLLRDEGPQALFAGVVPALVLVINPILQYTLFEQMKNAVEKKRRVTPTVAFFLGALGKLFATTVTYPYITVKSQMHVAGKAENKEGVFQALRRVVRDEGYQGLYKGMCFLFFFFVFISFLFSFFFKKKELKKKKKKLTVTGIGAKVTQSVLTAALLFAFKDVLYEQTVRLRMKAAAKKALAP